MTDNTNLVAQCQDVASEAEALAKALANGAIDENDEFFYDGEWVNVYDVYLEKIDERGRNFALVATVGGPHIQIEWECHTNAYVRGYWGGEYVSIMLPQEVSQTLLEWFFDL